MSLVEISAEPMPAVRTSGFKKGVSGNPKGRPQHARQRFTAGFMTDLAETWQKRGKPCLDHLAKNDPATFVRVCASLIPKEVKLEAASPLDDLSEAELKALTAAAKRAVEQAEAKQLEHAQSE